MVSESEVVREKEAPLSVSSALLLAKNSLESFTVTLIGEVSELNNKAGYKAVYFTVKDSKSSLPCMMWLNRYQSSGVDLKVGMLVELVGRFTLYAPKGRMNFDVFGLAIAGEGNLRLEVANLAKKLQAEGLMMPEKKKPLPVYPQSIGLVTSPRGAAVHDVLRTLRRRYPMARILLAGVPVEGEAAAENMIDALGLVEKAGAELVLLVRGGGSFEDLMPFNDEALVRRIHAMTIPVVTGIGHEPDNSIADMVADFRASTPTAAAEAVSPSHEDLLRRLDNYGTKMSSSLTQQIERREIILERVASNQLFLDSNRLFANEFQMTDLAEERLYRAIPLNISRDRHRLERGAERLKACGQKLIAPYENRLSLGASRLHDLSPLTILARGYAVARDSSKSILKSVRNTKPGDAVTVDLADGRLFCDVKEIEEIEIAILEELDD